MERLGTQIYDLKCMLTSVERCDIIEKSIPEIGRRRFRLPEGSDFVMTVFEIVNGVLSAGASMVVLIRAIIDLCNFLHDKRK